MTRYFFFSLSGHVLLLALCLMMGTLLSQPRMSYYAVDLMSSSFGGGGAPPAPAPSTLVPVPVPVTHEEKAPLPEAIKILDKHKKAPVHNTSKSHPVNRRPAISAKKGRSTSTTEEGPGNGGGITGTGGAGIVAEAGPAFPYPWYLTAIADRLDKQWHPPQEFQTDTVCQVSFVIHRDGQLTDSAIEKPSGDTFFDQLAMRAVLYANPLVPLPSGFPDETLRVHMKFVGKPQ